MMWFYDYYFGVATSWFLLFHQNHVVVGATALLRRQAATTTTRITTEELYHDDNPSMTRPNVITTQRHSVNPDNFPTFVQWEFGCGGSLIHEDIVLSAAHCYYRGGYRRTKVYIGSYRFQDGIERTITEFVPYPEYDSQYNENDFVILKLDSPLEDVEPITLNSDRNVPSDETTTDSLNVVGFGMTQFGPRSTTLRYINLDYVPFEDCENRIEGVKDDRNICAGSNDPYSCLGDCGGPLYACTSPNCEQQQQVGIVSRREGCETEDFLGVYSRVSYAYEWIQNKICMHSANPPSECAPIVIRFENYANDHSHIIQLVVKDNENIHIMYESEAFNVAPSASFEIAIRLRPGSYRLQLVDFVGDSTIDGLCSVWRVGEELELINHGIPGEGNDSLVFDILLDDQQQPVQYSEDDPQVQPYSEDPPAAAANNDNGRMPITIRFENYSSDLSYQIYWWIRDSTGLLIIHTPDAVLLPESDFIETTVMLEPGNYLLNFIDLSGHPAMLVLYSIWRGEGTGVLVDDGVAEPDVAVSFYVLAEHQF